MGLGAVWVCGLSDLSHAERRKDAEAADVSEPGEPAGSGLDLHALWKCILPSPGGRMTSAMGQAPGGEQSAQSSTVKGALERWPGTEANAHASCKPYHNCAQT